MRIALNQILSPQDEKENLLALRNVLNGNLGLDNFRGRLMEGTTSGTADTSKLFKHSLNPPPFGAVVVLGNAYVFSVDKDNIDVRSTQTNVNFKVFCLNSKP